MESEHFIPSDPKYKEVKDLPEAERKNFIDLPEGGFVMRSAKKNYDEWEKRAYEANLGRGFWKRIFMIDRTTALELAHAEANDAVRSGVELEQYMERAFKNILLRYNRQIHEFIDEDHVDSVLSEDAGGRFPAEVFQRMLNLIYTKRGEREIPLIPLLASRSTTKEVLDAQAEKIVLSKQLGRTVLYVTEMIFSGGSSQRAIDALGRAISKHSDEGIPRPEMIALVTMAASSSFGDDGYRQRKLNAQARADERKDPLFMDGMGEEEDGLFSAFSGVTRESQMQGLRGHLVTSLAKKFAELYLQNVER